MSDSDKLQHRPFAAFGESLKKELRKTRKQARRELLERHRSARPEVTVEVPPPEPPRPPITDEAMLAEEMRGVQPLGDRANYVPGQRESGAVAARDSEAEAMAELADLVSGRSTFDLTESDEYIEGIAQGLDKRLLKKLRQGFFAVQAHLDLHGRTRAEARQDVESFILESRLRSRRCVLIVHGRGLNSKDQIPVLKESLKVWLGRGRIARAVLAFCTARPSDGGAGAVYVLLRK